MQACFKLPENNTMNPHTDTDVVNMLNSIGYFLDTSSLGNIKRKGLRKEWSFLSDAFIKVFSGKIGNIDAITTALVNMLYMLLSDKYFNFSNCVMIEIGTKLGDKAKINKNIYYARFIMLLANHVSEKLEITKSSNKLDCWVQEKRVLADLIRNNLNNDVPLSYLPIFEAPQVSQVSTSVSISSHLQAL